MSGPAETTLRRALKKISKPGAWTQGTLARNRHGDYANPASADAECWCASGAIAAVERSNAAGAIATDTLLAELAHSGHRRIWEWNDEPCRTQVEVIDMFAAAVNRAKEMGL